jgi:hypothetical protein
MRTFIVASVLTVAVTTGCGGSGSGGAGAQFCNDQATAWCKKVFECTPADMKDATFNMIYGTSATQCASMWATLCTMTPPAGQVPDINCSGGKHVNTAARDLCLNDLATVSCTDFNDPNHTNTCNQVCTTTDTSGTGGSGSPDGGGAGQGGSGAGTGGAGGSLTGAGGTVGTGSGGSSGTSTALGFCLTLNDTLCNRTFACTPADQRDATFVSTYGSTVTQCYAMTEPQCAGATCSSVYSPSAGAQCIADVQSATCDAFLAEVFVSTACANTCP